MFIAIANAIGKGSGIGKAKKLVNAFKTRVLADGGIFEAEQCTINLIKSLL
jgi:hypothetical protein